MARRTTLRVFDANLIYLIGSLLFFTIGFAVQQRELYTGLVITQLAVVLLPPFLYLELGKMNVRQVLRLQPISLKQGVLAALITIFMYPAAVTGNLVMLNLLSRIGTIDIPQIPMAETPLQYVRLMLIISVLAGVCEEVFFRGFVLRGYERMGPRKAIFISALLFAVFHYNIYNLFGAMVLGLVFGALVWITDSLYAGIIGHMVNNGFAVTLGYMFNLLGDMYPGEELEMAEAALGDSLLASLLFFGVLALLGGGISVYLFRKLKDHSTAAAAALSVGPALLTQESILEVKTARKSEYGEAAETENGKRESERLGGKSKPGRGEAEADKVEKEGPQEDDEATAGEEISEKPGAAAQWWEFFPLTGVIPLFFHVMYIQIAMLLGRF